MKLAEIRKKFLNYFESKNHEIINSSDLVPKGDDSILSVSYTHLRAHETS